MADLTAAAIAARLAYYAPVNVAPWESLDERTQRRWRRIARTVIAEADVVEADALRSLGEEWFRQASYDAGSYLTCKNEMLDLIPERNT